MEHKNNPSIKTIIEFIEEHQYSHGNNTKICNNRKGKVFENYWGSAFMW